MTIEPEIRIKHSVQVIKVITIKKNILFLVRYIKRTNVREYRTKRDSSFTLEGSYRLFR